ncbi:MAG: DUF6701 domain-containing protein, partial [Betaproteobacteria bacterium]
ATATGDSPTGTNDVSDDDAETVTLTQTNTLVLTKTGTLNDDDGTAGVSVGDTISYTFSIQNTGNTTISNIDVTDPTATVSGSTISTLAPGATDTSTFTATYTITQSDIDAGSFTNTATATGDSPTGTNDVSDDDTEVVDTSGIGALDHYAISITGLTAGTATECDTLTVTATAHDSADSDISVTLSDGQLVVLNGSGTAVGLWNDEDGNGVSDSDPLLSFSNAVSVSHTVQLGPGSYLVSTSGSSYSISENSGFSITSSTGLTISHQSQPMIAGESETLRFSVTSGGSCSSDLPASNIEAVTLDCVDPSDCQLSAGQTMTLSGQSITESPTTIMNALGGSSSADLTAVYTDAGEITLTAKARVTPVGGDSYLTDAATITLKSSPSVIRLVDAYETGSPSNKNPEHSTPAGDSDVDAFLPAGTSTTLIFRALNAAGNITPNFSHTFNTLPSLSTPTDGTLGAFNPASSSNELALTFSGGTATSTFTYSDVGSFSVAPSTTNYLSNQSVSGASATVGRFYPSYFDLAGTISESCGTAFTYFEEAGLTVNYSVTAKNVAGNTTQNYTTGTTSLLAYGSTTGALTLSNTTGSWSGGIASFAASDVKLSKTGQDAIGPFSPEFAVKVTDTDGATFQSLDFEATVGSSCGGVAPACDARLLSGETSEIRFGRLRLAGASGPETAALAPILEAQYYNGVSWSRNTADVCTSFGDLTETASGSNINNLPITIGSGSTSASYAGTISGSTITLSGGTTGLSFSAPGIGNTGSFNIQLPTITTLDHLKYDWNGDGEEFPSPATITFGSYRGHDKVLSWKVSGSQ